MELDRPIGQRFSQVYLDRGKPGADSKRMRARLGAYMNQNVALSDLGAAVRSELGVEVRSTPYGGHDWPGFFTTAELRDVLDAVTLCWALSMKGRKATQAEEWRDFAERVFREEQVHYEVDSKGGVHFAADEEHVRARASAVAGLGLPRYAAALAQFDAAHRALDGIPQDTVGAVRGVFDALETIFKLASPGTSRLGAAEITNKLRPMLTSIYAGNDLNAANLNAKAFGEWVNAAHHYRHAPGVEDPAPPPIGLALALVGSGTAYLRWVIEIDQAASR